MSFSFLQKDLLAIVFMAILAGFGVIVPLLNLLMPEGSFFHIPTYAVSLLGKYICFEILALSLDLVW